MLIILLLGAAVCFFIILLQPDEASTGEGEMSATLSPAKILDFSGTGLNNVSEDVFENESVTAFDVSNNFLTGSLPAEIRKLSNLEELYASNNQMTGIPAEIGQLNKLRIIDFSNNNISGLPLELGNLSSLELLDLRGNPNISMYDLGLLRSKLTNTQILTN